MHDEDPAYYVVPDTRELIAQYLLLYATSSPDEDLSDLKSSEDRHLRLSVRIQNVKTMEMAGSSSIVCKQCGKSCKDIPHLVEHIGSGKTCKDRLIEEVQLTRVSKGLVKQ